MVASVIKTIFGSVMVDRAIVDRSRAMVLLGYAL